MKLSNLVFNLMVTYSHSVDNYYGGGNKVRQKRDPSIKFEARSGRDSLLNFVALNSTNLEVFWIHSFDINLDMVQSAVLYSADNNLAEQLGQADPPFDSTSSIITDRKMDLCSSHKLFVTVKPKEGYEETHILRETTWYPPSFLKVIYAFGKLMP